MPTRRFATLRRAAQDHGVTDQTIRNWIGGGHITAYKLHARKGVVVDLTEVAAYAAAKGAAYGSFGPNAKVVDLSTVVSETFDVEDAR